MRIANRDIIAETLSFHSQKSLSQPLEMIIPSNQTATEIIGLQQRISLAREDLSAAAAAVNKDLTAVGTKVAAEEAIEKIHFMEYHNYNQKSKTICQIITPR